ISTDGEISYAVFPDIMDFLVIRTELFFPCVVKSLGHDVLDGEIPRGKLIGNVPVVFGVTIFQYVKKVLSVVRTQVVAIPRLVTVAKICIVRKAAGASITAPENPGE